MAYTRDIFYFVLNMTTKEIEISYEAIYESVEAKKIGDEMFRVTVALKPKQIATVQLVTHFINPFPIVSIQSDDSSCRVWLSEVCGSVVRIKAKGKLESSAQLFIYVIDGTFAKRLPL